jgi:hypothetical protein
MAFGKTPKRKTPKQMREAERKHARRVALKALRKAKKLADSAGVKLSDWEGEFLGSVEERIEKYGRAFGDPEKGSLASSLSIRQSVKVKEIVAKASGKPRKSRFRRRTSHT